jgi:hypothetical protein
VSSTPIDDDPDREVLKYAVRAWHAGMSAHTLTIVRSSARQLSKRPIRVGHLWAGSNISMRILYEISAYWSAEFGEHVTFDEIFMAENHEEALEFEQDEFPNCQYFFRDVYQLADSSRAYCVKHGAEVLVPPVDLIDGGYPCQTKSPLVRNRSLGSTCIQHGEGKTGKGFIATNAIIKKLNVDAFMLENRPFPTHALEALADRKAGLSIAGVKDDESDLSFCIAALEGDSEYAVGARNNEASEFGSRARRDRSYTFGFEDKSDGAAQKKVEFCMNLISMLKMPMLSPFMFLPSNLRLLPAGPEKDATADDERCYRDVHLEAYQQVGMSYPPDYSDMPVSFREVVAGMTTRKGEVAYYIEKTRPYPSTQMTPQFIDVNMSLQYLLGDTFSNECASETIPTLTTTTTLWCRMQVRDDEFVWRVIAGRHLLRIIGWGDPKNTYNDSLCKRLAGNAYSAFAAGPTLLSILVAMGMQ